MISSCYVHVPFCDCICSYCDFTRLVASDDVIVKWKSKIISEIKDYSISELETLYFGGGTPSLLDISDFTEIRNLFPKQIREFTIECNPESIDESKIKAYKELGVNRVSLGVQSFNDDILKVCNRRHTSKEAISSIKMIQKLIPNLSIDLIFGLPNQTLEDVKRDIEIFLGLDIPHLSIYSLQIEPNSIFGKKRIEPCDSDLEADMFEYIVKTLKENGYEHYEISSFCKDGKYSSHNLAYWQDLDFYGIGCGASGKLNNVRYDNTKNLKEYLDNGPCVSWIEESRIEQSFTAIMMGLRTKFGLNIDEWDKKYNLDFMLSYKDVIHKYEDYFEIDNNRIRLNDKGLEILNTILVDFMMIE